VGRVAPTNSRNCVGGMCGRLRLAQRRQWCQTARHGLNLPLLRSKTAAYGHRGDEDPQGGPTRFGDRHLARGVARRGRRAILWRRARPRQFVHAAPPRDVPSVPPAPDLIPPSGNVAPPAAKGPLLQPPAANPGCAGARRTGGTCRAARTRRARGQRPVRARAAGHHRRIALAGLSHRPERCAAPVKEDKGPAPTFILPPGPM
jgi:hypothetical protein